MKRLFLLIMFCFMTASAWALPNQEGTAVQSQAPGTGTTVALQCGTNPNRLVHVAVSVNGTTTQMSGITYNAVSLTESITKATQTPVTTQDFYLNGAASGSNTLSMTMSASANWAIVASCWSGVNPTNPIGTAVKTTTTGTTSISVNATGFSNGLILSALGKDDHTNTCSPGGGQTEIVAGGRDDTNSTRVQSSSSPGGGTITVSWASCTNFINAGLIALPVQGISANGAPFIFPP